MTRTYSRETLFEAALGLVVVVVAVWFVLFSWQRTGGGGRANATEVRALFPNASGVSMGTDVRIAGLKVGTVTGESLDPESFQVALTLAIDPSIKIPADSSAAITSEGLLGATYVSLIPGGDPTPLKSGDTIVDTQGSLDLMGLIGQFINKPGASDGAGGGDAGAGNAAAAPAP